MRKVPGMGETVVRCEVVDAVATITLDSPGNRNALSRQLVEDLNLALDRAEQPDVRAIVLTHTAPAFCAGADLKERLATTGPPDSSSVVRAIRRLEEANQPTIAALTGPARAGGLGLMAACDLVVVAPTVDFALTEVRIGVAAAMISVPILRRAPWSKLAAAFLTGETFSAATAKEIGLITHVADDVAATVAQLVEGILLGAPGAIAATKRLLRTVGDLDRDVAYPAMAKLSGELFDGPEGREGMTAFIEKRRPSWQTGVASTVPAASAASSTPVSPFSSQTSVQGTDFGDEIRIATPEEG
jgi:enoyl-CoA hydratase